MTKKKKFKSDPSTLNQKTSATDGGKAIRRKANEGKLLKSSFVLQSFLILFFVIAGFSLYSKTLSSPFVFDDIDIITENRSIRLTELTAKNILNSATGLSSNRPVSTLTFALNYYFGRYDPEGYHFVNIAIHVLNAILLFIFLKLTFKISRQQNISDSKSKLSAGQWISFFAALVWLVHPIQTQSVTYIVQRMNSIGATFFILALLCYVMGRTIQLRVKQESDSEDTSIKEKTHPSRTYFWFTASAVSGLLALGSKESTATLPFFVYLYEWYFFQDLSSKWFKSSLKYIIAVAVIFGAVAFLYLGTDPLEKISKLRDFSHAEFTLTERALTQTRVVVYYLSLIFFPHPSRLNLDYDFPLSYSLFNPITTLFSLILIIGLVAMAFYLAKRERLISFCTLWFFGNLVIESSIIPLAIIFEHRNYLPSMLVCLIPVILVYRYIQYDWLKIGLLIVLIVGLSVWTYQRNRVWENEITLWSDVVKKSPNKARANFNLGSAYSAEERIEAAIPFYLRALEIDPNKPQFYINLGDAMEKQGNTDKAFELYETALKLKPNFAIAHNNLAILLAKRGNTDEAIQHYLDAIKIDTYYAEAHFNLASVLVAQGDIEAGIDHYLKALQLQPDYTEAHNNLGGAFAKLGRNEKAIVHYTAALKLDPSMAEAHNNLGIVFMQEGKIEEAIDHFRKALQIQPDFKLATSNLKRVLSIREMLVGEIARLKEMLKDNPDNAELHFLLGNMYFRAAHQQQAIEAYKRSLRIDPTFVPALNNLALVNAVNKEYYKALTVFFDVLKYSPEDPETHYNIACMYSRLRRTDESIKWLKKAIEKGYTNWENIKNDSDLDNIRDADAYKELIKGH